MPAPEEEQGLQMRQDKLDVLQEKQRKGGQGGCSVGSTGKKGVRSHWESGKSHIGLARSLYCTV